MRNRILFFSVVMFAMHSCSETEVNPYWGDGVEFIEIYEDSEIFNDSEGFKRNGWGGNIMVALDGTVLTDRRSEDGGKTWGDKIPHLAGDGRVLDEATGDIINLHSAYQPEPLPLQYRSSDHGKTWLEEKVTREKDINGWIPFTSACEEGITLQYGKHKGRLLMAARVMVEYASARDLYEQHYSSAVYSDDPGGSPDRHTTAGRENITVWASFDGGKTWPVRRLVHERVGYSHLAAGRPGTPSEGMIYLITSSLYARFNLAWITRRMDWRKFLSE